MTIMRMLGLAGLASLVFCAPVAAEDSALAERIVTVQGRADAQVALLEILPRNIPVWGGLLVYVGGSGAIGLKAGRPPGKRGGNFLYRTADHFAKAGLAVAVIDNPSDSPQAVWNRRSGADHASDGAAAIAHLRNLTTGPVWVIGTSMGTVSAASLAARLGPGPRGPDGVVVTSSIVRTSKKTTETVLGIVLSAIRVPFLAVRHTEDACFASPPEGAETIIKGVTASSRTAILTYSGGKPAESDECEPFAGHGFFGVEQQAVDGIISWIRESPPP